MEGLKCQTQELVCDLRGIREPLEIFECMKILNSKIYVLGMTI